MEFLGLIMIMSGVGLMALILFATISGRGDDSMLASVNEVLGVNPNADKGMKISMRDATEVANGHSNDYDFGPALKRVVTEEA